MFAQSDWRLRDRLHLNRPEIDRSQPPAEWFLRQVDGPRFTGLDRSSAATAAPGPNNLQPRLGARRARNGTFLVRAARGLPSRNRFGSCAR